jgi:hypothetical protein
MLCELIDARANRAGNLTKSLGPVGFLACPARFERATYALEEFVAAGKSIYFNDLQRKNGAVQ